MTASYQEQFIMPEGIYALSHSVGPLCKSSELNLHKAYLDEWKNLGGDAWPNWLGSIDNFCRAVANLLNTKAHTICPQANLASGFSAVLTAIAKLPSHKHQNTILMHQDAFASMGFVVTALSKTYGLRLVLIKEDPNDIDAWMSALEQHSVLACLITHVHSNTSLKSDVKSLCRLAKQFEAFAMVDIAQSAGVVPVDLENWQADAVFGSCVKWLCGGPGAGFLHIRPELIEALEPDPVGWFSHQNPFEFDIEHYSAAPDAKRFLGGTPSVAPYIMASASIQALLDIGIPEVVRRNHELKTCLLNSLPSDHISKRILDTLEKTGGSLCLATSKPSETIELLRKNDVKYDQRNAIFRISLHIMNTQSEAQTIASCFN